MCRRLAHGNEVRAQSANYKTCDICACICLHRWVDISKRYMCRHVGVHTACVHTGLRTVRQLCLSSLVFAMKLFRRDCFHHMLHSNLSKKRNTSKALLVKMLITSSVKRNKYLTVNSPPLRLSHRRNGSPENLMMT